MKTHFILAVLLLCAQTVFAAPQHFEIKKTDMKKKQETAKAQIKNIDLKNIEDPEARKAIREILNYLNLKAK